jgi:hypothetical protein
MNRINLFHTKALRQSDPAVHLLSRENNNFESHAGVLVFAGLLIACSLAVGCSSEKPKQISSNQIPMNQPIPSVPAAPVPATPDMQTAAKPAHKKIVRHAPTTLKYVDNESGVSFRYSPKYVLKTGDAADEMVSSNLGVMDFTQPGGVVTAAVEIPEGAYPKTDLVSAMFDVSVNKSLTAEQCADFSDTQPDPSSTTASQQPSVAQQPTDGAQTSVAATQAPVPMPTPKLILGDMELTSTDTTASTDSRKEESKYYHVFENGACYEFSLKVATTGVEPDEGGKPVDHEEVFKKLEGILATVKISPVKTDTIETEKQTATAPVAAPTGPAQ